MLDVDTFLTTLDVRVDDFCPSHPPKSRPGPDASLCESEVLTLAIFARWSWFASERDFNRYASGRLTDAFPTLPERSQFNCSLRPHPELIEAFSLHLVSLLTDARKCPYQALDSSALPIRDRKRRGHGWSAAEADIGWYEGFSLLTATDPTGIITGFCFSAASSADQSMAEGFFAIGAHPDPRISSVGSISWGPYIADEGFEVAENHRRWQESYGALVIHPPKRNSRKPWSKRPRRWLAGIRQIAESLYDKLFDVFGPGRERPELHLEGVYPLVGGEAPQALESVQQARFRVAMRRSMGVG
jgi:hypothetical protein